MRMRMISVSKDDWDQEKENQNHLKQFTKLLKSFSIQGIPRNMTLCHYEDRRSSLNKLQYLHSHIFRSRILGLIIIIILVLTFPKCGLPFLCF